MTRPERQQRGGGLSLTTLVLASISSGIAALLVSRFWENGTVISAAVTPILVALFSEALRRPTERLGEVARPLAKAARPRAGRRGPAAEAVPRFGEEGPPPRVYGGRRVRLQVVLITAVLAFVIAASALTVPELLLLNGSVAGGEERTTYFGGKASPRTDSDEDQRPAQDGEQTPSTTTTETETETETAPTDTGTTPTDPAQPPQAPAPTEPAPQGGQPAPPAATTPK